MSASPHVCVGYAVFVSLQAADKPPQRAKSNKPFRFMAIFPGGFLGSPRAGPEHTAGMYHTPRMSRDGNARAGARHEKIETTKGDRRNSDRPFVRARALDSARDRLGHWQACGGIAAIQASMSSTPRLWVSERPRRGIIAPTCVVSVRKTRIEVAGSPGTMSKSKPPVPAPALPGRLHTP